MGRKRMPLSRYRKLRRLVWFVIASLTGCGGNLASTPPNVVLVCLDTVRADHLGCYGYEKNPTTPFMDKLAARATVLQDVSSTAGWTKPSVPSFLTGTYPFQHGVYYGNTKSGGETISDVLPDDAVTLAEVFRSHGYVTAAFVKNAHLRKGMGFEQGFETFQDRAGSGEQIRWKALDWVDGLNGTAPFFLYLHFLDAHWPYPVPERYACLFAEREKLAPFRTERWRELRDEINRGEIELDGEQRDALISLYDGSLRYLDDQLRLFWRSLERFGLLENTILCIISDHGEEFLEHGRIGHGHGLYRNLLHVPWILYLPGRAPRSVPGPASLIDLFPTLLHAAEAPPPFTPQGIDRLKEPERREPVFSEHLGPGHYAFAFRKGERKTLLRFTASAGRATEHVPLLALREGTCWEASLERGPEGDFHASRLEPSRSGSDELEIKGTVSRLDGESFRLNGVKIYRDEDTKTYVDQAESPRGPWRLEEGETAKAKGRLREDGVLMARLIKLYATKHRGARVSGRISRASIGEAGGWIEMGGLKIHVDGQCEVKAEPGKRMRREDVVEILRSPRKPPIAGKVSLLRFDLQEDPMEVQPIPSGLHETDPLLAFSQFMEGKLGHRIWTWQDRTALTEEDMEHLRALGYVN